MGHAVLVSALAISLALSAAASAQRMNDEARRSTLVEEDEWSEIKGIRFPPIPTVNNLIRVDSASLGTSYEYFIDGASILLGTDGVTRYTVVLQSDSGTRNVYFEGIRCETMQTRTYAYATPRGGFKPLASSTWKDVRALGPFAYRLLLAEKFMCDSNGWPINEKKARAKLVRAARGRPSGRQADDSS
jgi:hypothetical protein